MSIPFRVERGCLCRCHPVNGQVRFLYYHAIIGPVTPLLKLCLVLFAPRKVTEAQGVEHPQSALNEVVEEIAGNMCRSTMHCIISLLQP